MLKIVGWILGVAFALYFISSVVFTIFVSFFKSSESIFSNKKFYLYDWPSMAYILFVATNLYYFEPLGSDGWRILGYEFIPLYAYVFSMLIFWGICLKSKNVEIVEWPTMFVAAVPFVTIGLLTGFALVTDAIITSSADYPDNHGEVFALSVGHFISMAVSFSLKDGLEKRDQKVL